MSRRSIRLGDALDELIDHRGQTPKKLGGNWSARGHRVVSAINIKENLVDDNDHHYVDDELYVRWMRVPLQAGDVLLTSEAPTGEVAYLEVDTDWCLGQRVFGLRGRPDVLTGRYLFYLLRGGDVRNQLLARGTGTTVSGIRQSELVKVNLSLPPVHEQTRVAATLGTLDDRISSCNRAHDLIWALLGAEFEALSESGAWTKLGGLAQLEYGKSLIQRNRVPGLVPVFGSSGIAGWHNEPLIGGPAVIVGRKGSIGEVHWSDLACYPIDTTFYVRETGYPLLAVYFALQTAGLTTMNSDSAVPGLNRDAALAVEVLAPTVDAAVTWAQESQPLVSYARSLRSQAAQLSALRDSLMPELLSGRLTVRDATPSTEAVA